MKIIFSKNADKQLAKLKKSDCSVFDRVMKKIAHIRAGLLFGEKLKGSSEIFKFRVGNYRVLYSKEGIISVEVIAVEKRGRVYRKIK